MTTKHTPGPWTVYDWTICGPKGEEIAALADEYGPLHKLPGEIRKGPWTKSTALMEANSALIASAPELLEALEDALGTIENYESELHERMGTKNYARVVQNARAAIAKVEAKGEA